MGGVASQARRWLLAALVLLLAALFARVPDLDLDLRGWLHHRSILTHSLLPPALVLLLRDPRRRAMGAGALVGTAAHLAADATSSPVGFALVWTPWPFRESLGDWSPVWLGANALLGFALAARLSRREFGPVSGAVVAGAAALATAVMGAGLVEAAAIAVLCLAGLIIAHLAARLG